MRERTLMSLCFAASLIVAPMSHAAAAADSDPQIVRIPLPKTLKPAPAFGVGDYEYTIFGATSFNPIDSATVFRTELGTNSRLFRTAAGGSSLFFHEFNLPPGAALADATAFVYDNDANAQVRMYLAITYQNPDGTNQGPLTAYTDRATDVVGTPGETTLVIPFNFETPAFFDVFADGIKREVSWSILIQLTGLDANTAFHGVRLRWKRQVSDAPTTARFEDVPTSHPFFRFVEALASAGITGGCSTNPPQYCPDAPVTRGQMAVFLSTALGLHFTP